MGNKLLYLVRHGEPLDGNTLSEAGIEQSKLLGQRLRRTSFTAMHHSTMGRAAQTAKLIAGYLSDVPVHASDSLRECIPTVPSREVLTPSQAEFFDGLPERTLTDGPVQAEAVAEHYLAESDADSRELIISHGNLINWLVCRVLGAPEHAWLNLVDDHCGLSVLLRVSGEAPKLVAYNDVGHLPASLRATERPVERRP